MNRVIWSVGGTGLVLAGLTVAWLHRPLEPLSPEKPAPTAREPGPPMGIAPKEATHLQAAHATGGPALIPPEHVAAPAPAPAHESLAGPLAPTPPSEAAPARARRKLPEPRLRLVQALRGAHPTPEARRDAVLAELAASGDSGEPWTEDARAALDRWKARVEEDVLPVRAEPPRCFAAGCVARVTFPDAASFDAAFQGTSALKLGTASAHLQLPPERLASGEVVASWVVLRPDAP